MTVSSLRPHSHLSLIISPVSEKMPTSPSTLLPQCGQRYAMVVSFDFKIIIGQLLSEISFLTHLRLFSRLGVTPPPGSSSDFIV